MPIRKIILVLLAGWLAGCAVNPVTGEHDLILVSNEQELAMGAQNYVPMQQSEGGQYDVDPGLAAYIQSVGRRLADASGVKLPYEFTILNNSVPNAWALPGGKIAVNRGLLTALDNEAELAAVLGHEITHAAARHTAQQQSRGMLLEGLVAATGVVANDSSYADLLVGSAGTAAQLLTMKYGRGAELEADKYGMRFMSKAGYDPQGAVTLQETFVRLSEGDNQDWLSGLFATHPPSQERVEANRKTAKTLPAGGILGADRYAASMKTTMAARPAYDAYDAGRKALAEKHTDEALADADKAIRLFPREANFYALRGDARFVDKHYDTAVKDYNDAISHRPDFFYYYQQRGLAKYKLGQTDAAASDLKHGIDLLPTAPAYFTLGQIEEQRGNRPEAIANYKIVARSGGEYGKAAAAALARLELSEQPASYIASACGDDGSGRVAVQVRNDASVAVAGVQATFEYVDAGGVRRRNAQAFDAVIQPGKIATARTGLALSPGSSCTVQVTAAHIAQ
ncbi:MAG: M48 family metalloprotease [Woeseiaceae bacterium]